MKNAYPKIALKQGTHVLEENAEVEWYSGREVYTHPRRIKINGVWEDVFQHEKIVRENGQQQRETVFCCHIGDNRIVEVIIS